MRDNAEIAEMIVAGLVDFGLMLEPTASRDLDIRAFVEIPLGLIVPPGHALEHQPSLRFNQVAGYPMVMPDRTLAIHDQVALLCVATPDRARSPDRVRQCPDDEVAGEARRRRRDTELADVISEVRAGTLCFVPLTDTVLRKVSLALCIVPRRQLSKAANLVFQYIERELLRFEPPNSL